MENESFWRPTEVSWLALQDVDLAKIGMTAVLEALAKSRAATALKAVERQTHAEWVRMERWQFEQICTRLIQKSAGIDKDLEALVQQLNDARLQHHEKRHIVVHAVWGVGLEGEPVGYDWGRRLKLDAGDIASAMEASLALERAAHRVLMKVAHLVGAGVLPEGTDEGSSIEIGISNERWVKM
jgi:hypothetical protein